MRREGWAGNGDAPVSRCQGEYYGLVAPDARKTLDARRALGEDAPRMKSLLSDTLSFILTDGERRPETVSAESWGRRRDFVAFDLDDDTFVLEDGIWDRIENKDPVVIVPKRDLQPAAAGERVYGNVMTFTSGNHAVAAMPLLSGQFWDLADIPEAQRSDVLRQCAVCCNCVGETLEISQREVSTERVMDADGWLQGLGVPMDGVLLADRVDETLEAYRRRGQEWRIRPLAWTDAEMAQAIRATRHTLSPKSLVYYHNVKGVFFVTLANFIAWGASIAADSARFRRALRLLAAPSPADGHSFLNRPKYGPHHEVEFFGIPPNAGRTTLVPLLERLVADADGLDDAALAARFAAIVDAFRGLLVSPDYADETSPAFTEALYRNITGEVYQSAGDVIVPAFDDRRAALPGATYLFDGSCSLHPTADGRTEAILAYLESSVSHGDRIEYVNIYEVRSETEDVRLGQGKTREIVFKTAWSPLPLRLIEKRLSQRSTGYGTYTMTRVEVFRALGISYGRHRLLARHDGVVGEVHFFVRERYPGESFNQIPRSYLRSRESGDAEDADILRALIRLMGGAAAENLVLKKIGHASGKCQFGREGKEIVEFGYDVSRRKEMPLRIRLCSIRGTMGWPDYACTEENLARIFRHYADSFAGVVRDFAAEHPVVPLATLLDEFLEGFNAKTFEIHWNFASHREQFESYSSAAFRDYQFDERWRFVLWALDQQRARLAEFGALVREAAEASIPAAGEAPDGSSRTT